MPIVCVLKKYLCRFKKKPHITKKTTTTEVEMHISFEVIYHFKAIYQILLTSVLCVILRQQIHQPL